MTTFGRGVHDVTQSPSALARHLGNEKLKGHGILPPNKRMTVAPRKATQIERACAAGASQAVCEGPWWETESRVPKALRLILGE